MENCIKPYKYEVEVDEREWGLGREHADQAFTQEIKRCEAKLGEIRDKVGGGRRLNGLVSYVAEVERAEEDRRQRRMSGEVNEEEQGPMDVYKYSPAQVVDGESPKSEWYGADNRPTRSTVTKPPIPAQTPRSDPQIKKMSPRTIPTGILPRGIFGCRS